jgi:hypothetical protein
MTSSIVQPTSGRKNYLDPPTKSNLPKGEKIGYHSTEILCQAESAKVAGRSRPSTPGNESRSVQLLLQYLTIQLPNNFMIESEWHSQQKCLAPLYVTNHIKTSIPILKC